MLYKVVKNGDVVLATKSYKNAANTYDKAIYNGKRGDIIRLYCKKDQSDEWELARKDWL